MKYKKSMIIVMLTIFIFAAATVSAGDVNDAAVASEDAKQMDLSAGDEIAEDNQQTSEEKLELSLDDESLSEKTDTDVLGDEPATYSVLAVEINKTGNVTLTHKNYTYDDGAEAITISEANKVIDGDGAVIDMKGSTIRAFYVTASGVTIKNLTIKNANYNDDGGAIFFAQSGSVTNCNFTDNIANRYGGAVYFSGTGEVTNCNLTGNTATYGGAVYFDYMGTVTNCNFAGNTAYREGGAIKFSGTDTVTNCNFVNNAVTGEYNWGGAIMMYSGSVSNCNFTGNTATGSNSWGGAIRMNSGTVSNCNFTDNEAYNGGAIRFNGEGNVTNCNFTNNQATATSSWGGAVYFDETGTVTDCNFADNSANLGGAILSYNWWTVTVDTCIFKTDSDTIFNTCNLPPTLNIDNFTTVYGSGDKLTFDLRTNITSMPVTNGNISISLYFKGNNSWLGNYSCLSGEGWIPDLPAGSYYVIFDTEYAEFKPINRTITVNKAKTELFTNPITATYNTNKAMIITLKDKNGKPVAGVSVSVDLKGAKNYITDKNGQVKINAGKIVPKTYHAKIIFKGNNNFEASQATVKVTVKKAKSKITAKKKTAKKAKYVVTLKSGKKPIKKAKVILKIKKKTFRAKTNKKGKATFKIKKLKKGKYTAKITFKGNKYYKKSTKKVRLRVR